jgi:acyl-CoA thioesterase-2
VTTRPAGNLAEVFDLERIDDNIFRGWSWHTAPLRVFGGHVAAQALVAAGRTAPPDRPVHSLHAYFLRPGDPSAPIVYEVDRIRDGGSFTTRRVVAVQHGEAIFTMSASFHREEAGYDHQAPMPPTPSPEHCAPMKSPQIWRMSEPGGDWWITRYVDIRRMPSPDDVVSAGDGAAARAYQRWWVRIQGELGDDPLLHVCAAAYASDLFLLGPVVRPHLNGEHEPPSAASLDHAMWFHRPFRVDGWLLYEQDSPSAYGARGFGRGQIYTEAGELVVSVAQEGLIRPNRDRPVGRG